MALIDQQEAAKQIRGNKEWLADCQWLKGFNDACEQSAQIVEQMKGQEIIRCKDCEHADDYCQCKYVTWWNQPDDYCSRGKKKGEAE